jgi:D-alanyl-D-alanine carboxypeptidase
MAQRPVTMSAMRVGAFILTICVALGGRLTAADPVDEYIRAQMAMRHLPGVSIVVVQNGRIVKAAGYGLASLELNAPATERTVYEIGSISKQFAANAILLLVEDGKIQLDDLLSKYLARTPPAWSGITIRHVLTHTAGLADFDTGNIGFSYRREYTPDEFVELLGKQPLGFAPGERWNYTNAFPLLGIVVERASGMPYVEFVRTRIFEPLGLESARFKSATEVVPHRADGYVYKDGRYQHGETLRPMVIAPNGGILINVVDFAKWDIALTAGKLLRPASIEAMTTPVRLNDGRTVSHGLGWFIDTFAGHTFGAHWGSTVTGHSAVIRRYVRDGVTVIMLANLDDGGTGIDAMSKRIADMFVPGVAVQGLPVVAEEPTVTNRMRAALSAVAAGRDHDHVAPGFAARLPQPVRTRLGDAITEPARWVSLGDEVVTAQHFNLDPALARLRRYRVTAGATARYLTVRLDRDGHVIGVLIEDA